MFNEAKKSGEGAIMINHQNKYYVLVDYMQEYAGRMAKTGYLTDDTVLFFECVNQFLIYENLLRDCQTGLWCQGRGWCEDTLQLAQGAWSRGHGWLMRGIVVSMFNLPDEYKKELLPVLERVSYSLLKVQAKSGMYHILLNLPGEKSEPDVSGTGMIAYYLSVAVKQGWLSEKDFKTSILKSTKELKKYISNKGEVFNSSQGPGPLCNQDEYIGYKPEKDERHGFQAIIYGMIAEIEMKE